MYAVLVDGSAVLGKVNVAVNYFYESLHHEELSCSPA